MLAQCMFFGGQYQRAASLLHRHNYERVTYDLLLFRFRTFNTYSYSLMLIDNLLKHSTGITQTFAHAEFNKSYQQKC
jgi:hypothetical protein